MSVQEFSAFGRFADATALTWTSVTPEEQTSDYESGTVAIGQEVWHIRTARTTPTKPGAFLAFWSRDADGQTRPFPVKDCGAGLMIFVEQGEHRGVFEFTTEHLDRLGIAAGQRPGKRGFRVYPDWCTELNRQATATQRAQAPAFRHY